MARELTGKQKAFVTHYIANGFNGTQAARSAGYKGSDTVLASEAHDNIRKPHIKQAILSEMGRLLMSAEEVAARLAQIARGEPYAGMDLSGNDVVRSLIQIGKMHQMWTEHVVIDWRAELREQGIEDAELFEQMVQRAYEVLTVRQRAQIADQGSTDDGDEDD